MHFIHDHFLTLVIVVAAVVGVGVLGYKIMQGMKGTLRLNLTSVRACSGESFSGTVTISCKKPIEGHRLIVTLILFIYDMSDEDGDWKKLHEKQIILEEARQYMTGFEQTYVFEHRVPTTTEIGKNLRQGWSRDFSGTFISGRDNGSLAWKIEGRLDATGVDLTDSHTVYVYLS